MYKLLGSLGMALALGCGSAMAQSTDNSANRSGSTEAKSPETTTSPSKTSGAKSSRAQDRKLLAAVRRAVVGDKSLSTSAHNVKMTSHGGVVTLRGTVRSEEEKSKVEQLAQQVSGVSSVENSLGVKAQRTSRKGSSDKTARSGTDGNNSSKDTKTN